MEKVEAVTGSCSESVLNCETEPAVVIRGCFWVREVGPSLDFTAGKWIMFRKGIEKIQGSLNGNVDYIIESTSCK